MKKGLILYGPPASGKDTITAELVNRNPNFQHFERLKCGPGRTIGYRMISPDQADHLRQTYRSVLWENTRYGATYFVDRSGLEQIWNAGRVPVVHLGQVEAVSTIANGEGEKADWTVVELYCSPEILRERIKDRATGDEHQRFAAAEQTPRLPVADIRIDTASTSVASAVSMIATLVQCRP
ncbi:kinase [Micromonospora echinofusca]|uniref:kinase n=1 Tax=Micromonospora echinofusca TaxID=47858 RepID=UPI00340AAE77